MSIGKLNDGKSNWLQAMFAGVTLVCTIFSAILAGFMFFKATEHPPIYDAEIVNFYEHDQSELNSLRGKLNTGAYAILAVKSMGQCYGENGKLGDKYTVVLGKIKN